MWLCAAADDVVIACSPRYPCALAWQSLLLLREDESVAAAMLRGVSVMRVLEPRRRFGHGRAGQYPRVLNPKGCGTLRLGYCSDAD